MVGVMIMEGVMVMVGVMVMDEALQGSKGEPAGELDLVRRMFLAGESMQVERFVEFFHDDALYMFENFPIARGPQGIIEASQGFLAKVAAVDHHIKGLWKVGDGVVVCEMEVTYRRRDGRLFTLPCCDTIRIRGNKVQELRIYMNITPVLSG